MWNKYTKTISVFVSVVNCESVLQTDLSSDKPLSMIDFIRLSFEEQREYIYKYNFRDNEEKIDFFNSKPLILSNPIY